MPAAEEPNVANVAGFPGADCRVTAPISSFDGRPAV